MMIQIQLTLIHESKINLIFLPHSYIINFIDKKWHFYDDFTSKLKILCRLTYNNFFIYIMFVFWCAPKMIISIDK